MATIWYVFLAIVLLGVMIFTHELGHFIVGRVCGFAIEEFSIGFLHNVCFCNNRNIFITIGFCIFYKLPYGIRFHPSDPLPFLS